MNTKIIFVFMLVCSICFFSCSSEETQENQQTVDIQTAYKELNESLARYNASFMHETCIVQTRKGKFLKKLAKFLCADASGALIGGSVGGGVGAIFGAVLNSALAGPAMAAETRAVLSVVDVNSFVTVSEGGIGYLHNTILSEIEAEHPGIYNENVDANYLASLIVEKMEKYGYYISTSEQTVLINKALSIVPKVEFETIDQLTSHYQQVLPQFSNEMNVIQDFVVNVEDISDDIELVKAYTEGYQKVVAVSNLPEPKKLELKSSLDVAANSAVLWEVD